jgi:hypothetical protein
VYPSIGTLIGIGQKNSLNFVFTDFGVVENFLVLRSSSSLNKIWLEVFIIPLLIYFIAFYFKYYAYNCFIWIKQSEVILGSKRKVQAFSRLYVRGCL